MFLENWMITVACSLTTYGALVDLFHPDMAHFAAHLVSAFFHPSIVSEVWEPSCKARVRSDMILLTKLVKASVTEHTV